MAMTKFADQLFDDLMQEFRPTLDSVELPAARARRTVPRPVWLAAGTVGMAGAITAGVVVLGGGTPAYAVTQNTNGTVTVSINELSGVAGANDKLHTMGEPVVVVPVRPGCVSIASLPHVTGAHQDTRASVDMTKGGSITVDVRGVPAGATALVATSTSPRGIALALALVTGPIPSCVSMPQPPPDGIVSSGPNSGVRSSTGGSGH
jgi:hypothetical protein